MLSRNDMNKIEDYFESFLLILFIVVFLVLIRRYILALFFASTLTFLMYPFYQSFVEKKYNKIFSALFLLFIVVTIILFPIYLVSVSVYNQSSEILISAETALNSIEVTHCNHNSFLCSKIMEFLGVADLSYATLIRKAGNYFSESTVPIFNSLTNIAVNLFIFILTFFYLLRDGDKFLIYLKRITPMKTQYKIALFNKFREVSLAVFGNNLLIGVLQGSLVGFGFFILGIKGALFWAFIASFASLIPYVGPALVWFPVVLYFFFTGQYGSAIFLQLWGMLLVGLIDNFARPFLLKSKIEVHPLLIMLSIFGGINTFGVFLGIFLGPIIISLLISIIHLYNLDFK